MRVGEFITIWFVWLGVRGRWVGGWYVPERLLCSSMCRAFILHTASRLRDSAHGTDPSGQYSGSFPYLCAHARNSAECVCAGVVDAGIPAACDVAGGGTVCARSPTDGIVDPARWTIVLGRAVAASAALNPAVGRGASAEAAGARSAAAPPMHAAMSTARDARTFGR